MQNNLSEILINAYQVTRYQHYQRKSSHGRDTRESYEFILNDELQVLECVKIESMIRGIITPIKNITTALEGLLFELNHVRVNPKIDNSYVISCLTQALEEIGVRVSNPANTYSIATCYKPMGEISDNVRFYLSSKGSLVFLSPATRPRLVYSQGH